MGRTIKAPTIQQMYPDAQSDEVRPEESLYWFGMLPANGTFKSKKWELEKQVETDDYFRWIDVTSEDLWDRGQWVGKCPFRQSLSVNGFGFDAFTETVMVPVGSRGATTNRVSWPGGIMAMDENRAKAVIASCYKNVARYKDGAWKEINLEQPVNYRMLPNGDETSQKEAFNPRTDTLYAHYVYFVKLEASPEEYDRSTYYRLAAAWPEFFGKPPKSVFEMYPQAKQSPAKTEAAK